MKILKLLAGNLILIAIFASGISAQRKPTPKTAAVKIAVINSGAFDNSETGIKEFNDMYDKLEEEFKPQSDELKPMIEKLQALEKEIKYFDPYACYPLKILKIFENKLKERDLLLEKYKVKQEAAKTLYDKRRAETVGVITKKVGDAIKQFAKEKGYLMILDSSIENSSVIIEGEIIDVTEEFIKYYNENFAKNKTQ